MLLRFSLLFVRVLHMRQAQPHFDCSISSVSQRNERFKLVNGVNPRRIDERAPFPKINARFFAFTQLGYWFKITGLKRPPSWVISGCFQYIILSLASDQTQFGHGGLAGIKAP